MAANRGEIATRIFRAGTGKLFNICSNLSQNFTELNLRTIGVYTQVGLSSLDCMGCSCRYRRMDILCIVLRRMNAILSALILNLDRRKSLAMMGFFNGSCICSNLSPVGKYLNIEELISIANAADADAIHPGYGFLAESADFARACTHAGIKFIGPPASVVQRFGDKTEARKIAIECGVPVIPGSDGPVATFDEAKRFCTEHG